MAHKDGTIVAVWGRSVMLRVAIGIGWVLATVVQTPACGGAARIDPGVDGGEATGAKAVTTGDSAASGGNGGAAMGAATGGGGGVGGTPECPATDPDNGTPCDKPGQGCFYLLCGTPTGLRATCLNGRWLNEPRIDCTPTPRVIDCPPGEPNVGTVCGPSPSQSCWYPNGCGGQSEYQCVGYQWRKNDPDRDAAASDADCRQPEPSDAGREQVDAVLDR